MRLRPQKFMEILKIQPTNPTKSNVSKIVSALDKGKIVVLPTDTVYTFAVDATNSEAIDSVYKIKGRNYNKPFHVIVSSLEMAKKYVEINDCAKALSRQFLPGPLTLILKKRKKSLPDILTSKLPTLGIRMPNLKLSQAISEAFKKPFTTTSANISGGRNPYSVEQVLSQLSSEQKNMIGLIVDIGKLPKVSPSTIVDVSEGVPKIPREGPVTNKEIKKVSPEIK